MPELAEVETIRRSLEGMVVGGVVDRVQKTTLARIIPDEQHTAHPAAGIFNALGKGQKITAFIRHGKQLAMVFDSNRVVVVQLGMSGQLFVCRHDRRGKIMLPDEMRPHIHVRWRLQLINGQPCTLCFRDARRFGCVRLFASVDQLHSKWWHRLGPDALTIRAAQLRTALQLTKRPIKATLLDQKVLAGVGNIYADESLFLARIRPITTSCILQPDQVKALAKSIRQVLRESIKAGGSTLRDFVDGQGRPGYHQVQLAVYGRSGLACVRCTTTLVSDKVTGRTTVWCPACQR